jgi:hypothetical protein
VLRRTAALLLAALALCFAPGVAAAADPVECPPGSSNIGGRCVITIGGGGGGGTPIDNPGGGSGGGASTCTYLGREIPCTTEDGVWNATKACYAGLLNPQPPAAAPVWEGNTDGVIVQCVSVGCGAVVPEFCTRTIYWAATAPAATGPSPRELADMAVSAMDFRAPEIGITGKGDDPDSMQIIGLPTWLWVTDPDEHTVGPITRSASAGGITVTATGALDRIVWNMGDGRSVTCTGSSASGTAYEARYQDQPSPTCGHRYTQTSAGRPNEAYTVNATAYWTVTWVGGGQSGTIPLTFTRSTQLRVGELQVIVTDGTGR